MKFIISHNPWEGLLRAYVLTILGVPLLMLGFTITSVDSIQEAYGQEQDQEQEEDDVS